MSPTDAEPDIFAKHDLEDVLRKVQAMLQRADHPNTPAPEAEACRVKAELFMLKYRIDEATLNAAKPPEQQLVPTWRTWTVCSQVSEYQSTYREMSSSVLNHFGLRGMHHSARDENGYSVWQVKACGYAAELILAEVLYTEAMLAFQSKVEPRLDPQLSDQVNAYRLRKAGMEGRRIAEALYGENTKSLRSKVRAMFRREAQARGEDPDALLGDTSVKQWRTDYAQGFSGEFWSRLGRMRTSRGESGQSLVLMDQVERVNEAYYEVYPQMRPASGSSQPYRAPNHGCERCEKAKSGYCAEHRWLKPSTARPKARRTNWSAYDQGQAAARSIDLGPGGRGKIPGQKELE